ncbi:MAG TPA: hypothetical protein VFK49_00075 [Stellaceae bacterium]|nr:hypothetical protein [Stellaceae bacterium]
MRRLLPLALLAALALAAARPAEAAPCIGIVTTEGDRLGFRNACGECKVAVWAWGAGQSTFSRDGKVEGVWQGGKTWTRKYRIPAHGAITVREEAPTGKLRREEPCTPSSQR